MASFKKARILVIGDSMVDRYAYGTVDRMCPEAPVPVLSLKNGERHIGGAGLVAVSLANLGCEPVFVSVIGDDPEGKELASMLRKAGVSAHLATEKGRKTTVKTRFMRSNHPSEMLLRVDSEETAPIAAATEDAVLKAANEQLPSCDLVVISDYLKGMITPKIISAIMQASSKAGKKVIVDSKKNLARFKGAYLAIPNAHELSLEFGKEFSNEDSFILPLAKKLASQLGESLIVKRSEKGATLIEKGVAFTAPSSAQKVASVVGAGDIFVAIIAASICSGMPLKKAVETANKGCAVAIGKERPSISASDF